MNVDQVIKSLQAQKAKIDRCILALQNLKTAESIVGKLNLPDRRGRKSMGEQERLQVSARMKKYWSDKRAREGSRSE